MRPQDGVIQQNEEIISLLQKLSNEEYSKELVEFSGSSIGQHIRHVLEFFQAVLRSEMESTLCYDERERKTIYEVDIDNTIQGFQEVNEAMQNIDILKSVALVSNTTTGAAAICSQTTISRELVYCIDHSIHHLAIVKIGLKSSLSHIDFNENIGIAPSTIRYQESCAR